MSDTNFNVNQHIIDDLNNHGFKLKETRRVKLLDDFTSSFYNLTHNNVTFPNTSPLVKDYGTKTIVAHYKKDGINGVLDLFGVNDNE